MRKIILIGALFGSLFANDVVAVVNGEKITKAQINQVLKNQNITYDKLPSQIKKRVLDRVITQALLIKKAENSGVTKTKEYKEALDKVKKQLAVDVYLKQHIKVSDAEIKQFYQEHKRNFKQPAQVKARHIVVKTKQQAQKIIEELKNTPYNKLEQKFIELAKKYSIGPSGKNGGELGWFSKKRMVPAFSEAAFNLKKGHITLKPVKTQFGWHVIYVEDKKAGGYVPLNQVKEKIRRFLIAKKLQEYIQNIKKQAHIQYK
ncbi:MAG: peptidylprolyl isomerase [Epsilonproteobacteria bacterium]|nr:peptidylprolyl isomerase [Campylobacterota bacterium]